MSQKVDGALDEVLNWVHEGAKPLEMPTDVQEALRERWLPDFEEQIDNLGVEWNDVREMVLSLAEQVGRYARILTLGWWSEAGGGLPETVREASAVLAGYIVASTSPSCHPAGSFGVRGGFCQGFENPAGPARAVALDERIRPLPVAAAEVAETLIARRRTA